MASLATASPSAAPFDTGLSLFSTETDADALAGLSFQDLLALHDACRTMMSVAAGLGCQPRFRSEIGSSGFNAAGEQVDLFHEVAANCLGAVINEAAVRKPADREEAVTRAWLLSRSAADCSDAFGEFFQSVAHEHASVSAFEVQPQFFASQASP